MFISIYKYVNVWLTIIAIEDILYKRSLDTFYYHCIGELYLEHVPNTQQTTSGGRLNKKDGLTRYGDSHVKDKTS